MAEELTSGQDSKEKEEIITKLTSSIEEVASSTQTVYEAVEQVAKMDGIGDTLDSGQTVG